MPWASGSFPDVRLTAHPSAVYGDDGSGDVVAGMGAEEESGSGEILRLSPAACGDAFEDLAVAGLVGLQGFGVGGGWWRSSRERWR